MRLGWRAEGRAPWRWICGATHHTWKTAGWHVSPNTAHTHYRDLKCTWCGAEINQKDYCDARKGEMPANALPE